MPGRTATSLLHQVNAWHRQLARSNVIQVQQWRPVGLAGLRLTEGQTGTDSWRQWLIRELLSTKALTVEGQMMRHCVASYTASCARGQSSIWTMERKSLKSLEKCVTLEVQPATRTICQIRGRLNRPPTEQEMRVVHHWAEQADLRLASYMG